MALIGGLNKFSLKNFRFKEELFDGRTDGFQVGMPVKQLIRFEAFWQRYNLESKSF